MRKLIAVAVFSAGLTIPSASLRAESLKLTDLPEPVQKTIAAHQAGADLKGIKIDKTKQNGMYVYDVDFQQKGKDAKMRISADGSVISDSQNEKSGLQRLNPLGKKTELTATPAPVQAAIRTHGGEVASIHQKTRDGRTVYEVEFKEKGRNPKLVLAEDGTVVKEKDTRRGEATSGTEIRESAGAEKPAHGLMLSDLPEPVQKTVKAEFPSDPVEKIQKESKDGKTVYSVHIKQEGKNPTLKIAEDGSIIKDSRK